MRPEARWNGALAAGMLAGVVASAACGVDRAELDASDGVARDERATSDGNRTDGAVLPDVAAAVDAGNGDDASTMDASAALDAPGAVDSPRAMDAPGTPDVTTTPDSGFPRDVPSSSDAPTTGGHPAVISTFAGEIGTTTAPGVPTDRDHPDMAMAASGSQIVTATDQSVIVYDHAGTVLRSQTISAFIAAAGLVAGTINDPRVYFDPLINRWLLACSCSNDYLMVSAGADATGAWRGVALSTNAGDLTMRVGFDRNGVYVSEYHAGDTNPNNAAGYAYDFFALPAADVQWTGAGNVSTAHMVRAHNMPFEGHPAIDLDPTKAVGAPNFFVGRNGPLQVGVNVPISLVVNAVTWSGTTPTFAPDRLLPTGYLFNTAVDSPQPGSPAIRGAENHRIFSVMMRGTHAHTVMASGPCTSATACAAQGVDAHNIAYWLEVDTTGAMSVSQRAKLADPTLSLMFPALALDGAGNVGIAATGIAATRAASVYLFSHLVGDPPGSIRGPVLAFGGTNVYSCMRTPVGWGTYSTVVQDPGNTGRLWAFQEYGGSATPCDWTTRLVQFQP